VAVSKGDVFLTGGTGFIGSHVLRALLDTGYPVRALVRPGSAALPEANGLSIVRGDLARCGELVHALRGCRFVVHTAALYSFAPRQRRLVEQTNVMGTRSLLEAARIAGVERAVVTSSSATVGPAHDGRPATEEDWAREEGSGYHASKVRQERVALAARVPVVLLLPTMPVGPNDWKPTPTGKMIVDFMRGRIVASLGGGLNVVPVEDVAQAHVAALERGRDRERYLLGGENVTLDELWGELAQACGRAAPTRRMPYLAALSVGWADELRCRVVRDQLPLAPLEGVRMARHAMWVRSGKARSELGFEAGSARAAIERAVAWYRGHGYAS
jgi:dihydroflavonol-4-reductase